MFAIAAPGASTRPKFKHMATADNPSVELPAEVQLSVVSLEQIITGVMEWLKQPPATTENPTGCLEQVSS